MQVTIVPNRVIDTIENETLMDALIRYHLPIQAVCNGEGTCGKCKVRMTGNVPAPSIPDLEHLNDTEIKAGVRLACTVTPEEGMFIELNFIESQDRKEGVLLGLKATTLDPGIEKVFVKTDIPSLADERGDWDRFVDALSIITGKSYDKPSLYVLRKISAVLRTGEFALTATIDGDAILDIEAGDTTKQFYGVSIDIGTTSIAVALVDLNQGNIMKVVSAENEQTAYGADVISRITYARESEENALTLRASVRRTINRLLEELSVQTKVSKNDMYKMTLVGNTTMHHLFVGLEVSHLSVSPFVSVCNRPLDFTAEELEMEINPKAKITFLPNIGSFVGADTVGAIMGAPVLLEPGNHLLIDLGTNCELFLKTDDMMIACSTAAGPAFEGAGIVHGMRAKIGAVEGVTLTEDGSVTCQVIGDQEAIGICGSGLIEGIDEMRKVGILTRQGKIVDPAKSPTISPELLKRIQMGKKGREFVLTYGTAEGFDVTLGQKDIGELQLAKGAVCAGIKTLVEMAKLTMADLDSVTLSGTFATYLKADNILNIGLVPDIDPEKIKMVGNAAHVGGLLALIDRSELAKSRELYRKISHVELGGSPQFSTYFMTSMYLEKMS